jgi:hypothetical protein
MELERYLNRAGPHDPRHLQELELMISRIAGKIAHPLLTQLRTSHHDPLHEAAYIDLINRLFKSQKDKE